MLQWNPRVRVLLVVCALLALALAFGWSDYVSFLEW